MIGNLRAIAFVLSDLETGRLLGHALVCQEARYVSIAHAVAGPLERLHASPQQWRAMASDLTLGLPPTPLPADGAFARLLVPDGRRRSTVLQQLDGTRRQSRDAGRDGAGTRQVAARAGLSVGTEDAAASATTVTDFPAAPIAASRAE